MTERFREISRNRPGSIVPPSEAADLIALPPLALSLFSLFPSPFGASDRPLAARASPTPLPDRCPRSASFEAERLPERATRWIPPGDSTR